MNVQCTNCHKSYCWSCQGSPHPSRSCAAFRSAGARWQQFLQKYGSPSAKQQLGNVAADKKYFRDNVKSGNLKRCPKCSRLIQKMQGCNDMHCGRNYDGHDVNQQSGCGEKFRWSDVPHMSMQDLHHDSHTLELDINSSDAHFDPLMLRALGRAEAVRCVECSLDIIGAKFECLSCPPATQTQSKTIQKESAPPALCLACVLKHLSPDEKPTASPSSASASAAGGVSLHSSAGLSMKDVSSSLKDVPTSKHLGHVFDIINPPSMKAAATVMFASVLTSGEVLVYNIPSMLTPLSSSSSSGGHSSGGGGSIRSSRNFSFGRHFDSDSDGESFSPPHNVATTSSVSFLLYFALYL